MSVQPARLLAWTLLATFVAMVGFAVWEIGHGRGRPDELFVLFTAGFAVVGTVIAVRRPGNGVGWLLLVIAVLLAFDSFSETYVTSASRPARAWVGWVANCSWSAWMVGATVLLPLTFPSGRLPSRRWRPVLWLAGAALALGVLGEALRPGDLGLDTATLTSPLPTLPGARPLARACAALSNVLVAPAVVLAGVSLVVRYRRSHGTERQQLKWFAYVGVVVLVFVLLALSAVLFPGPEGGWRDVIGGVGWFGFLGATLLGIPAATGVAILRHRLLDIDLVISRTLVYAPLTVALLGVYVASVLVLQQVLRPFTGDSDLAVAVSTLATAALFRPVRAALQRVVDRRFYRRRYDAARILDDFGSRLRAELDLQAVGDDLRTVVDRTVQPSSVRLWLREAL